MLEDYGPTFHYKDGPSNVVANVLSQVPTSRMDRGSDKIPARISLLTASDDISCMVTNELELAECLQHDPESAECFLEHAVFDNKGRLSSQFTILAEYQSANLALQQVLQQQPDRFHAVDFKGNTKLICFCQNGENKIVPTQEMLPKVVKYYHEVMGHAKGMKRLSETIERHYHHKNIDKEVKQQVKDCTICDENKQGGHVYGTATPRDTSVMPWQEVHCDSIGPWKIDLQARTLTFHAMTMIDPHTNLVEIKSTLTTTSKEASAAVENAWLARYPRPLKIVSDQGPKFGSEFTAMCKANGIEHSTSTSRNPQGNSLIEQIQQTIGQVLRTVLVAKDPKSVTEGNQVVEETLATAMHAC
jgi:hypothetical protein